MVASEVNLTSETGQSAGGFHQSQSDGSMAMVPRSAPHAQRRQSTIWRISLSNTPPAAKWRNAMKGNIHATFQVDVQEQARQNV